MSMPKDEKAKFRVFFGEIEGNNETVRDALKSVAAAVNRTFTGEVKIIKVLKAKGEGSEEEIEDAQLVENALGGNGESPEVSEAKGKTPRAKRAPTYKTVSDLNLLPDGAQSLKDFFAEKK